MATKNSRRDQSSPLPTCPRCGSALNFHNDRREPTQVGDDESVEVFLCIHHGFFHLSQGKPIEAGM